MTAEEYKYDETLFGEYLIAVAQCKRSYQALVEAEKRNDPNVWSYMLAYNGRCEHRQFLHGVKRSFWFAQKYASLRSNIPA